MLLFIARQQEAAGADRRRRTSPRSSVDFIEDGIVMQTMGQDGAEVHAASCSRSSSSSSSATSSRSSRSSRCRPTPASPCRCSWPCSPTCIYHGVGIKEQGRRLPQARAVPAGRARGRCYILVVPIEFVSTFLVAALLADGPSLRQPARRPHPAGHLRGAHRRPCGPPSWYAIFLPLPAFAVRRSSPPSRCWSRSCRPTSSPCSPPSTSAAPSPEH